MYLFLTLVMLNKLMPLPLLIVSQSNYLTQDVDINSHTEQQTVQIQISWLLQKPAYLKKPIDLDLHCLQGRTYPASAGSGLTNPLYLRTLPASPPPYFTNFNNFIIFLSVIPQCNLFSAYASLLHNNSTSNFTLILHGSRDPDRRDHQENMFLISPQKHMLWVLSRSTLQRHC